MLAETQHDRVGRCTTDSGRLSWRRAAVTVVAMVAVFLAVTARLFLFPAQGMPRRVDAIVMLDGPGDQARLHAALRLAREHRAPTLVVSIGSPASQPQPGGGCPRGVQRVKVICFNPSPATTQGEAEFTGRLARQHHWTSVALVTVTPQDTRARLRLSRCFGGPVYVATAPLPAGQWPYQLAYEWGATIKALLVQRNC
jgi:uncharacterized SAM-binding protein YcdF (DUF218 family)